MMMLPIKPLSINFKLYNWFAAMDVSKYANTGNGINLDVFSLNRLS